ncbi:MAG: hypothetical protein Q8R00_01620 [Candidatus Nanoarchaeia archaeon]|nr:hypothetical protein [Candidatus Nanoarchaeia archaeon]
MMDGNMMGGFYGGMALFNLLAIGLVVLVYLWIYKIWKDINRKR